MVTLFWSTRLIGKMIGNRSAFWRCFKTLGVTSLESHRVNLRMFDVFCWWDMWDGRDWGFHRSSLNIQVDEVMSEWVVHVGNQMRTDSFWLDRGLDESQYWRNAIIRKTKEDMKFENWNAVINWQSESYEHVKCVACRQFICVSSWTLSYFLGKFNLHHDILDVRYGENVRTCFSWISNGAIVSWLRDAIIIFFMFFRRYWNYQTIFSV